jgi:uncharacterized membrane protein
MNTEKILGTLAVAAIMAISATAVQAATAEVGAATAAAPATEKCYGVAKAGKNEAIELPAGICEKLINGSLTPPAPEPEQPSAPQPADKK